MSALHLAGAVVLPPFAFLFVLLGLAGTPSVVRTEQWVKFGVLILGIAFALTAVYCIGRLNGLSA